MVIIKGQTTIYKRQHRKAESSEPH